MPTKFLLLGGGVLGFLRKRGGSANFIFMGVGNFFRIYSSGIALHPL